MTMRVARGVIRGAGLLLGVALSGAACGASGEAVARPAIPSAPVGADEGSADVDGGVGGVDAEPVGESVGAESAAADTAPSVDLSEEEEVTVERILGWSAPTLAAKEQEVRSHIELANRREEYVADCMIREGFEYLPIQQDFVAELIVDPDVRRDTPEWTQKYGFGMTTLLFSLDEVAPDGVGVDPAWLGTRPPGPEGNPNASYYHSLDEAGQVAYDKAYSGEDGFGGCRGDAARDLPDPSRLLRDQLEDQLAELDERVRATAAYFDATSEVDACMEVSDFTFDGYRSFGSAVRSKMVEAGAVAPSTGSSVVIDSDSRPPQPSSALEQGSPEWRRAIVEAQRYEILLATEFERCIGRDAWFDWVDRIAADERQAFLADNQQLVLEAIHQGESDEQQ